MQYQDPPSSQHALEAARYALLRRLSQAMRQHMVAHLHPVGVASHVLGRRLAGNAPDLARVGDDLGRVQDFARSAVATNLDVVEWLAPEGGQQVGLDAGVAECLDLLRGHFAVRGFPLRHQAAGSHHPVQLAAVRAVLAAVLFALMDEASGPADITLASTGRTVHVQLQASGGAPGAALAPAYRLLTGDEVDALARAEGVALARTPGEASLTFG